MSLVVRCIPSVPLSPVPFPGGGRVTLKEPYYPAMNFY